MASNGMTTTSSDMTWHATSQLTTVAHPTSPHNHPHYFISPRKQFHDFKTGHITTMEQQKARSQQRNGLGIALIGRLAHVLSASSFLAIHIYIIYIVLVLFSSETSAPARPGTTCNFIYTWIEWWKCVEQRQIEKTFRIPQKVLSVEENHFVTSNRQVGLRVSSMLVPSWCMKSNGYDAAGTWPTLLRVFRTQGQPTSFTAHLTSTSLKAWRNMAKRTCTNLNHGECDQSLWPRN